MRISRRLHVPHDLPVRAMTVVLTEEQQRAVTRRAEPLLLSAAAGSGKTSVLVERFVAAVRDDGIAPARILAITFTERAAGELRARVRARLLELGDRAAARDTEAAFVGTFHGFCARVLRAHSLAAGLDPDFAILDEGLAGRLREQAFKAALRDFLAREGTTAVDLLAAYGVDRVHAMIEQVHKELRSRGQRAPRLPAPRTAAHAEEPVAKAETDVDAEAAAAADKLAESEAIAACELLDKLLDRYGAAYEQLKRARGAVDFDDLELLTRKLLTERRSVRAAWSDRFELLMVDEFQDTNPRQLGILTALDRGNLFTVGDELQSIYGFRHADVGLFRARRNELDARGGSLLLTRNFRSREPLLDVVNAVFAPRFGGYTPLLAGRAREIEQGEPAVELLLTDVRGWEEHERLSEAIAAGMPHAQLWRQAEARLLAQRVSELVQAGQALPGEVVVLLRASGDLEVFERALQLAGLRTLAAVGAFWGHQQIGDLISYLRSLANPLDEEALYGALASPLAGCSRDCLALLAGAASSAGAGVWETALAACSGEQGGSTIGLASADRDALADFCARLQSERESASRRTISGLIERAIAAAGYREHVLGLDWGERRLANVHKLLRLARRFEASEGRDLRAFLDHVEYLKRAVKVEPDAPVDGVEPDAVRLMTIHAAKGLEFPVVCVADLGRQPNTQTPDLLVDGERVGLRLVRLDGSRSAPALEHEQLCKERRQREAEEEDRILYVAMTRARERLLLSGAVDFGRWPASRQAPTPISWLGPALAAELPALLAAGDVAQHDIAIAASRGPVTVRCRLSSAATVGAVLQLDSFAAGGAVPARDDASPAGKGVTPPGDDVSPAGWTAGEQLSMLAECAPSSIPTEDYADTIALKLEQDDRSRGGGSTATRPAGMAQHATPPGERLATLSYTSLSELERCGYRYYVERVLGLAEDRAAARSDAERGGVEARARGTLIHRLMESLDFAGPGAPSPAQVASLAGELGMRVSRDECAEIAGLIEVASKAELASRVGAARRVRREHPFAFSIGRSQPLITGVIDLLAHEPDGGLVVLDYKSDRVGAALDLSALVEREYGIQRLLYALAVLRGGVANVEVVHWFLERPQEPVSARFHAEERGALEQRLAEHVAGARARGFGVSPSPHRALCLTCPARAGLCSWDARETTRDQPAPDSATGGALLDLG
jgi:ATP-dependent helicase/nuclease subunit A